MKELIVTYSTTENLFEVLSCDLSMVVSDSLCCLFKLF